MSVKISKDEIAKIREFFGEDHILSFEDWLSGLYESRFSALSDALQSISTTNTDEDVKSTSLDLKSSLATKVKDLDDTIQRYKELEDLIEEKRNESGRLEFELASLNDHLESLRSDLQSLFIGADSIAKSDYKVYETEMRSTIDEINELRNQRWEIVEEQEQIVDQQKEVYDSGIPLFRDLVLFVRKVCDFILTKN